MTKTYFSKRKYKKSLFKENVLSIQDILLRFNDSKISTYNQLLKDYRYNLKHDKSLFLRVKEQSELNDYFVNSIVQEAKGKLDGQLELNRTYIKDTENQIKTIQSKIKDTEKYLKDRTRLLNYIIKGKTSKLKSHRQGNFYIVSKKHQTDLYYNIYNFEYLYLKPLIKSLKHKITMLNIRLVRLQDKLHWLKQGRFKGVTFGTNDFFKKQFTVDKYIENHNLWKKEYNQRRYFSMQVSGRKDAKQGNFVFRYDTSSNTLNIDLPKGLVSITGVAFPYRQEEVNSAINNYVTRRKPITWSIEDHGKYYIFKVTVDVPSRQDINYSKSDGLVGIDINYDHIAWTEIDSTGNLLDKGTIKYQLYGKSTTQATNILEQVAIDIVKIATEKHKPIILEKLDLEHQKSKLRYRNKLSNRKITQFAYSKMIDCIFSRANKEGVGVFQVNPAYTSQMGKFKFMKSKGLSIHLSAAYCIARRGLKFKFKESVPPVLFNLLPEKIRRKHHWVHWNYVSRQFEKVKLHDLYNLNLTNKYSTLEEVVRELSYNRFSSDKLYL